MPVGELENWFDRTYPTGRPDQWWISILESLENDVLLSLRREGSAFGVLQFAATLLDIAERRRPGQVFAAYWTLRLAGLAVRYDALTIQLPETFTPNESVRRALSAISLTQQSAVAIARRRNVELDEDVERLDDPEIRALQDFESLIFAMKWVSHRVSDIAIAARLAEWLDVYERTAPSVDGGDR